MTFFGQFEVVHKTLPSCHARMQLSGIHIGVQKWIPAILVPAEGGKHAGMTWLRPISSLQLILNHYTFWR